MSSKVSAAELGRLRSSIGQWLTEDAQLERVTKTPNTGTFGHTNARTVVWTGQVRRKPITEGRGAVAEAPIGDRAGVLSYWLFAFPAETDVQGEDRILAGGRTYDVIGQGLDKTLEIARYVVAREGT